MPERRVQPIEGNGGALTEPPPVHQMALKAAHQFGKVTKLLVSQDEIPLMEKLTQCCTGMVEKKYTISDVSKEYPGPKLFDAYEISSYIERLTLRNLHSFTMKVTLNNEVLYNIERPLRLDSGSCCLRQTILSKDLNGNILGKVEEGTWCCTPKYYIQTLNEENTLETWAELNGATNFLACSGTYPLALVCPCGLNPHFKLLRYTPSGNEEEGGIVQRPLNVKDLLKLQYGVMRGGQDDFLIEFPQNAAPEQRLSLVAAAMLVDFNHYERAFSCKPCPLCLYYMSKGRL